MVFRLRKPLYFDVVAQTILLLQCATLHDHRMKEQRKSIKPNRRPASPPPERSADPASRSESILWICVGLVVLNVFVYAGVWGFDFVNYDDPGYFQNPHVAAGLTFSG